jgi:hypothetical protein
LTVPRLSNTANQTELQKLVRCENVGIYRLVKIVITITARSMRPMVRPM